jgi:hypothetical protein
MLALSYQTCNEGVALSPRIMSKGLGGSLRQKNSESSKPEKGVPPEAAALPSLQLGPNGKLVHLEVVSKWASTPLCCPPAQIIQKR